MIKLDEFIPIELLIVVAIKQPLRAGTF